MLFAHAAAVRCDRDRLSRNGQTRRSVVRMTAQGEFSIGGELWPGLSKLIEECGEVGQVAGKIIGNEGRPDHWDGSHLPTRLADELDDLEAAIMFMRQHNPCLDRVSNRV